MRIVTIIIRLYRSARYIIHFREVYWSYKT